MKFWQWTEKLCRVCMTSCGWKSCYAFAFFFRCVVSGIVVDEIYCLPNWERCASGKSLRCINWDFWYGLNLCKRFSVEFRKWLWMKSCWFRLCDVTWHNSVNRDGMRTWSWRFHGLILQLFIAHNCSTNPEAGHPQMSLTWMRFAVFVLHKCDLFGLAI